MLFLSYRVADTLATASHLYHRLAQRYGECHVLWDKGRLVVGQPWPEQLHTALDESVAVLALVGKGWDTPRLDDPDDWVRIEVIAGHAQDKLYPLLVDGAVMPRPRWPAAHPLNAVVAVQGQNLHNADFDRDVEDLCAALEARHPRLWEVAHRRAAGGEMRRLAAAATLVHSHVGVEARARVLTPPHATPRGQGTVSTRALPSVALSAATGDRVEVSARAEMDGHLAVLVVSPDGSLDTTPLADAVVPANRWARWPQFELVAPTGSEEFVVAWSEAPLPTTESEWSRFLEELGSPARGVRGVPLPPAPSAAVLRFSVTHSSGR